MSGYISMDSVSDIKLNGVDVVKIAQGVNTLWEKNVIEPFNVKNISQSVATVDWNTGADNRNLEYSEDKTTWTSVPYANGKYTLTIPVGKKYYVQGNSRNFGGWWGSDQDVEISGYVLSLYYPTMELPSNQNVSYSNLFDKNKNGTSDGKLHFDFAKFKIPSQLNEKGCAYMFRGCMSITQLNYDIFYSPNGTYSVGSWGFASMFAGCTNLTRVDGFTFKRYSSFTNSLELEMCFYGCSSLTYVSDDLFDTTVTPSTGFYRDYTCRRMFMGCTSLTHPPKLPSVRGQKVFAEMFMNCTSLTNATTDRIMPTYNGIGDQNVDYSMNRIFMSMFYGCTGLTSMHDLSSYTMGSYGYQYFNQMYRGCTGITSIDAAKMPGGVATHDCFCEMFYGCTGITTIPSGFIKPTNTAKKCYMSMFRNCTSLSSVASDILPATALAESCYEEMFKNTAITKAPTMVVTSVGVGSCRHMYSDCPSLSDISGISLLATTLSSECYRGLFYSRCTSITTPLELPATTLAEGCYWGMYDGCVNLEGTVRLPAETLYHYSYATMFKDCNKLQGIEVGFKTWNSDYTYLWVDGITNSTGVFTCYDVLQQTTGASNIPVNWSVVNKTIPYLYFEDRSGDANTITCTKTGDQAEWLSLEYSTDWETWSTYDLTQTLTIPANGRVYLRGGNTYGFGYNNTNYHTFTCSGNYAVGGDLFSIMDGSITTYPNRFGHRTFYASTTLVDISDLVFGERAIKAFSFTYTFYNCTSLSVLPNEIGVSYVSGESLSANAQHFAQMFQYDNKISNFPTLPNIQAIGYRGMYCINQSLNASPNTYLEYLDFSNITTLYTESLRTAFRNASVLEVVKIGISSWPDFVDSTASDYNATSEWLYGVHPTGVFCKNSALPVMRGSNYIPNNWSIADLNGKLYDPVITNTNNTITISEGGGGSSSTIYYTTDGSDPDTTSNVYSAPFSVLAGTVIKAFADYTPTGSNVPLITHSNITTYTVQ